MAVIEIYSIAVCPFAQRSRMVLALKGVPFELTEIDITKPRPDWFLALNPLGQVPVIRHAGRVLNESSVINEYLEDVFPDPPVFPADPFRRAQSRILIDHLNTAFVPAMYALLINQDPARHAALVAKCLAGWRWLDAFLTRHNPDGTWLWDGFGMADLSAAPFFQRWCLNEHFRRFVLPEDGTARVRRWRDACLAHPLVIRTGMSAGDFIKLYADYALGYGNGSVPDGREKSSFDFGWPLAERPVPPVPDWLPG